jgi:hypothetical protein
MPEELSIFGSVLTRSPPFREGLVGGSADALFVKAFWQPNYIAPHIIDSRLSAARLANFKPGHVMIYASATCRTSVAMRRIRTFDGLEAQY